MNLYETDEEKAEALKQWWRENGLSVAAGIVLGLGAVFGWRAWIDYQDRIAQQASAAFEQLMISAQFGDVAAVRTQTAQIVREFPKTAYATFAELVQARAEVDAEKLDSARALLAGGIERAPDPGLSRLAALRLARLQIAASDLDGAAKTLDRYDDQGPFHPEFEALRGDIAAASGHPDAARAAYQRAIDGGAAQAKRLQRKRDDLSTAG